MEALRKIPLQILALAAISVPMALQIAIPLSADSVEQSVGQRGVPTVVPGPVPGPTPLPSRVPAPTSSPAAAPDSVTPSPVAPATARTTPAGTAVLPSARTASPAPRAVSISLSTARIATDALVNPLVTGKVSDPAAPLVSQWWSGSAWVTLGPVRPAADGTFRAVLARGTGELRSDTYRFVANKTASAAVTVTRTAVLAPTVRTVAAAEVSHSWRDGCPVDLDRLRAIDANYLGFDGRMHRGTIVMHVTRVADTMAILQAALTERFPIARMEPIENFDGSDTASMAANNTSGFNCRSNVAGNGWSQHAFGRAIDINPVQNPYHKDGTLLPALAVGYLDRNQVRPGMLTPNSAVVKTALARGWYWLDEFDFQHLQAPG